jgi:hypothetical protein
VGLTSCQATAASISVTAEESTFAHFTTETLLRLLLPLNDQFWTTFRPWVGVAILPKPVRKPHLAIQSVAATGGVYKRQGRNQRKLFNKITQTFRSGDELIGSVSVAV